VFAIPSHPSDARSAGPNGLIREGAAKICCGQNDFFDEKKHAEEIQSHKNKTDENTLFDKLGMIPLSESVLAGLVKKSVVEIKRDLVVLELQGKARKIDGGYVKM
jgi:predicted Rossmann fold nucleotide-binding protein DprA/Smf involved in DNA uptake